MVVRMQDRGAGVEVCSQPAFSDDARSYSDRLPPGVRDSINPYASFKAAGLRWCAGTDGVITGDDLLAGFAEAVSRQGPQAAAFDCLMERSIRAALKRGERADFQVWDADPFEDSSLLRGMKPRATYLGGKKVFERSPS